MSLTGLELVLFIALLALLAWSLRQGVTIRGQRNGQRASFKMGGGYALACYVRQLDHDHQVYGLQLLDPTYRYEYLTTRAAETARHLATPGAYRTALQNLESAHRVASCRGDDGVAHLLHEAEQERGNRPPGPGGTEGAM